MMLMILFEVISTLALAGFLGAWAILPLLLFTSPECAGQFGVATSLAVTVLLGTLTYAVGYFADFTTVLVLVATAANVGSVALRRSEAFALATRVKSRAKPLIGSKRGFLMAVFSIALFAGIVYSAYFDSLSHISPAAPDTTSVVDLLRIMSAGGNVLGYPPGWFALLQPAGNLMSEGTAWRFMGPALGVISILAMALLVRPLVGRSGALLFVAFMISPIGSYALKWMTGFWATSITVVLVVGATVALLGAVSKPRHVCLPDVLFIPLFLGATALTHPLPAIQWAGAALTALLLVALLRLGGARVGGAITVKRLATLALVVVATVPLAYLATQVSNQGVGSWKPPEQLTQAPKAPASAPKAPASAPKAPAPTETVSSGSGSIVSAMFTVKFGGLLPGPVSLKGGAVALLVLSLASAFFAARSGRLPLLVLSLITISLVVILQTGLLTPYGYTGRVAVYCIPLGLLLFLMVVRSVVAQRRSLATLQRNRRTASYLVAGALVGLSVMAAAPVWGRPSGDEASFALAKQAKKAGWGRVLCATPLPKLEFLGGCERVSLPSEQFPQDGLILLDTRQRYAREPLKNLFYGGSPKMGSVGVAEPGETIREKRLLRSLRSAGWHIVDASDGMVLLAHH